MPRLACVFFLLLAACRGDKAMGEACASANDCASPGLCAGGVEGPDPVCTRSCASNDECPEGWSCSGSTAEMIIVCVHRTSTPFGH